MEQTNVSLERKFEKLKKVSGAQGWFPIKPTNDEFEFQFVMLREFKTIAFRSSHASMQSERFN